MRNILSARGSTYFWPRVASHQVSPGVQTACHDTYVGIGKKAGKGFPDLPHKVLIAGFDKRPLKTGQQISVDLITVRRHGFCGMLLSQIVVLSACIAATSAKRHGKNDTSSVRQWSDSVQNVENIDWSAYVDLNVVEASMSGLRLPTHNSGTVYIESGTGTTRQICQPAPAAPPCQSSTRHMTVSSQRGTHFDPSS